MFWLILIPALLILLIMEGRIWRAVARLIYRAATRMAAARRQKDTHS